MKKKNKFNIEDWAPKDRDMEDLAKKNKKKAKQRNQESDDQGEEDAILNKLKEEERKMKEREEALKEQNKMKEIHQMQQNALKDEIESMLQNVVGEQRSPKKSASKGSKASNSQKSEVGQKLPK